MYQLGVSWGRVFDINLSLCLHGKIASFLSTYQIVEMNLVFPFVTSKDENLDVTENIAGNIEMNENDKFFL